MFYNRIVILVLLAIIQSIDGAIRCYKCTMLLPSLYSNETPRLCANFDYSEKYIVTCNHSTVCMKKDYTVNLANPINGTIRDCAMQKYDYQKYRDGRWQVEVAIEEPYEVGCQLADDKGIRNSRTQYCYCRGDLCNSAMPLLRLSSSDLIYLVLASLTAVRVMAAAVSYH